MLCNVFVDGNITDSYANGAEFVQRAVACKWAKSFLTTAFTKKKRFKKQTHSFP